MHSAPKSLPAAPKSVFEQLGEGVGTGWGEGTWCSWGSFRILPWALSHLPNLAQGLWCSAMPLGKVGSTPGPPIVSNPLLTFVQCGGNFVFVSPPPRPRSVSISLGCEFLRGRNQTSATFVSPTPQTAPHSRPIGCQLSGQEHLHWSRIRDKQRAVPEGRRVLRGRPGGRRTLRFRGF